MDATGADPQHQESCGHFNAAPPQAVLQQAARPFELARNRFSQPGMASLDLRLMKVWWVVKPKRAALELAADIFNLANHTNPLRVSPFYATGAQNLATYGGIVESLNARQIQFSLSLEY